VVTAINLDSNPGLDWWYDAAADRRRIEPCTICDAIDTPCDTRGGQPWYHAGRWWEIGITDAGNRFHGNRPEPGPCRPTVENLHTGWRTMRYRGACLGCGWAGDARHDHNDGVKDAHDHACPGWRALPAITLQGCPWPPTWRRSVERAYLAAGLDPGRIGRGWPVRTLRHVNGTRSHYAVELAGYNIFGGLHPSQRPLTAEQPTLF
jgi:hypothetical protein